MKKLVGCLALAVAFAFSTVALAEPPASPGGESSKAEKKDVKKFNKETDKAVKKEDKADAKAQKEANKDNKKADKAK